MPQVSKVGLIRSLHLNIIRFALRLKDYSHVLNKGVRFRTLLAPGLRDVMEEQTEKKQKRFAYSRWICRSIFLVMLILLVGIVVPIVQNGRAIQKLKSLDEDISIWTQPGVILGAFPMSWQRWLYYTLGYKRLAPFETVKAIGFNSDSINDTDLALLSEFKDLDKMDFRGTQVSDAGLIHLKGLTNLQYLTFDDLKISDAGLFYLKGLTKLDHLGLRGTRVTDAGLIHLKEFTQLKKLDLRYTKVTPAGVAQLQLTLPNCNIKYTTVVPSL